MENSRREKPPHARRLMFALRNVGYSEEEAIGDLLDNCLDAGADQIRISLTVPEGETLPTITIHDNGCGMDAETLDEALRLGSETERDPATDLGFYGMGLTTASFALGQHLRVATRADGGPLLLGRVDLTEISDADRFYHHLESQSAPPQFKSGTVFTIEKCDRVVTRNMDEFAHRVRRWLGEHYRWFLENGRQLWVNEHEVLPRDPLMVGRDGTRLVYDQIHSLHALRVGDKSGREHEFDVRVRVAVLPNLAESENKQLGILPGNQGYYILRNYRQIERAQSFGIWTRHNYMNRFRGEIFLPGDMDPGVGAHFTKRGITYSQSIRDQLTAILTPIDRTWGREVRREGSRKDSDEEKEERGTSHRAAVASIKRKAPALLKPGFSQAKDKGEGPTSRRRTLGRWTPRFEEVALSEAGPMWDRGVDEEGMVIRYNIEHPFYGRFLRGQNKNMIEAVDLLVFTLCLAEVNFTTERTGVDMEGLLTAFRAMVSMNMGILLRG